jgi:flagellar motor component MotA
MVFLRQILFISVGIALILTGMLMEGGHVSSVLQLTAALVVFGGTLGYLIASFPFKVHAMAFRAALTKEDFDESSLRLCETYYQGMGDALVSTASVGSILGLIHVMNYLDNPDAIGPGIAVAFVAQLYGFGGKFLIAENFRGIVTEKRLHICPAELDSRECKTS